MLHGTGDLVPRLDSESTITLNFSDGARMRLGIFLCEGHSRRSYGDNGERFPVDGEFLQFLLR
jgi:hypothetical protein